MTHKAMILAATMALGLTTAACQKPAGSGAAKEASAKISDADAAAAADAAQAAWTSMDAAKIESVYAKDVVAFDPMDPPMSTTWHNWDRLQKGFAAMKFNHVDVPDRKIQVLDAEDFIVSGTGTFTSKDGPMKTAAMRFTDVYRKQPDGRYLIVNEHVSVRPEPPKTA